MTLDFNIHSISPVNEGGGEIHNQNKTITENGTYAADEGYTGLGTVSVNVASTQPTLTTLAITPTTSAQTITPSGTEDGFDTVTVSGVTASIDADIVAGNIKSGVNILGVDGTCTELVSETKTITVNGTYTPTVGNGFTSVSVNVESTQPTLISKTITQNGTYVASDDSADGYSDVSVSVAGGGNPVFTEVDNIIDSVSSTDTYKSLYESGDWWVDSSMQSSTKAVMSKTSNGNYAWLVGYVLADSMPSTIYVPYPYLIKASSGATISYSSNIATVTFPTNAKNRYIIINANTSKTDVLQNQRISIVNNTDGSKRLRNGIRYINFKTDSDNITQNANAEFILFTDWGIEDYKFSDNVKFNMTPSAYYNALNTIKSPHISVKDFFDNYVSDINYGEYVLTGANNFLGTDATFCQIMQLRDYPFILDFSAATGAIYFNNTKSAGTGGTPWFDNVPKHLKMKLPYITLRFSSTFNASSVYSEMLLSVDSLKYLAQNAASGSGKTMTLGTNNINMANSEDTSIISTLTNKGWTVN